MAKRHRGGLYAAQAPPPTRRHAIPMMESGSIIQAGEQWHNLSSIETVSLQKIQQLAGRGGMRLESQLLLRSLRWEDQLSLGGRGYSRGQLLTPVIPALLEAEVGRSPEVRSSRLAWPTWQNPVSTKNTKISRAWWHTPIIPATQEAETVESLEPGAPLLPTHPPSNSNLASPVSAHTCSRSAPSNKASLLCPLHEVAGAEGIVRVHVPFSLSDLSAIEKRLGSFSTNPTAYIKEFRYLTKAYDLTWHDTFAILSSTLTPDERDRIFTAAREHANQVHLTDRSPRPTLTGIIRTVKMAAATEIRCYSAS
ncbi:putative uncharacterized protein C8orf44 [Plecturocebus cupreus]